MSYSVVVRNASQPASVLSTCLCVYVYVQLISRLEYLRIRHKTGFAVTSKERLGGGGMEERLIGRPILRGDRGGGETGKVEHNVALPDVDEL